MLLYCKSTGKLEFARRVEEKKEEEEEEEL
jgi:hypothetical protein